MHVPNLGHQIALGSTWDFGSSDDPLRTRAPGQHSLQCGVPIPHQPTVRRRDSSYVRRSAHRRSLGGGCCRRTTHRFHFERGRGELQTWGLSRILLFYAAPAMMSRRRAASTSERTGDNRNTTFISIRADFLWRRLHLRTALPAAHAKSHYDFRYLCAFFVSELFRGRA